jgi:hypothetical protein
MLLDRFAPTSQDHAPISSTYCAESQPCPIGRDDVCLDDMFHDIFGDWPLTGDPILWDDIRLENSNDYVVPESDEGDRFADVKTDCPGKFLFPLLPKIT